jgi:hypothetical protein
MDRTLIALEAVLLVEIKPMAWKVEWRPPTVSQPDHLGIELQRSRKIGRAY